MNMAHSPQDVYARNLVSGRGYPLWTPELSMSLPDIYRREGLKIGDVGVVVPEDGSFDVLFNICLPPEHSLHRETGVPDNFTPISLSRRDIVVFTEAEAAGRIISNTSVTRVRNADASGEDPERRTKPGPLNYEFTLSSQEGAILILPEGADRYYLRNERPFLDDAIKHAIDWYNFAEQRLGRVISHDSLYLITGFYKARSWSLAAYQYDATIREASAQFKASQVGGGNIPVNYTWDTTQAMDWRVGPPDQYYNGIPNQAVFIQGFKIAVREGILGSKWVKVKADFPSVRPYRVEFSSGSWFSGLWNSGSSGSSSGSTANTSRRASSSLNMDTTENNPSDDEGSNVEEDVTIRRIPQVTKSFHPSDIINQHLLQEAPSAIVAVTHDSQWTMLLNKGLLKPEELSQEDRLIASMANNYSMVMAHSGAVYLESTAIGDDNDGDAVTALIPSEGHPERSSIPQALYTSIPQSSDLDPSAADDLSTTPYTSVYDIHSQNNDPEFSTGLSSKYLVSPSAGQRQYSSIEPSLTAVQQPYRLPLQSHGPHYCAQESDLLYHSLQCPSVEPIHLFSQSQFSPLPHQYQLSDTSMSTRRTAYHTSDAESAPSGGMEAHGSAADLEDVGKTVSRMERDRLPSLENAFSSRYTMPTYQSELSRGLDTLPGTSNHSAPGHSSFFARATEPDTTAAHLSQAHTRTTTTKVTPSCSHIVPCRWIREDNSEMCAAQITCSDALKHFRDAHGIKGLSAGDMICCKWKECHKQVSRGGFARHIREIHLGRRRRSS